MAEPFTYTPPVVDPSTGFSAETQTFHSLRPPVPLPPSTLPLSFPSFALSLLPSPPPSSPVLIDASTGSSLSYPDFISQLHSLSCSLKTQLNLSKGDVAFILSPSRLDVPILYFSLLSLGAVVSPANPLSSPSEISRLIDLVKPSIIFATSATSSKLPPKSNIKSIFLDSFDFQSMLTERQSTFSTSDLQIHQSDTAAIQFSSGTTGRIKAAALSHRSFIAMAAGFHALRTRKSGEVTLLVAPMFHSLGFFFALKGIALGETVVVMSRVGFRDILSAAERYRATLMTAAPPVVVAMSRAEEVSEYDLGALETVLSGGAPLSVEVGERFMKRFPRVELRQGYGSTEGGGIARMINHDECMNISSVGRLTENVEAKIVDIITGKALSVGQRGELWLRGPAIMTGYVGDDESNASTFHTEGWLKTGDICYFDSKGFLYIVDRLKELIKYKGYQVPPAELEHLLYSLPGVADAAVVPYPQEDVGQVPVAFVVKQPGSNLSQHQIMDYVAKQVAPYKKIRKVVFINSIPKSASGKVIRRELANLALSNHPVSRL